MASDLEALKRSVARAVRPAQIRARLNGFLTDWQGLLTANTTEARGVLDEVLRDRIRFKPDVQARHYQLAAVPIGFDGLIVVAMPELRVSLQEIVPSVRWRELLQNV